MRTTGVSLVRWRTAVAIVASVLLLVTGMSTGTAVAAESVAAVDPCPEPFPVGDLVEGMAATGYTVERGTEPQPFGATVVGVINDGIGPDVDMIIVETDSPAIQRAGGIWAGMSGSPLYSADGRLVGAVSYGLSAAPSNVAGVTPAADMLDLLEATSEPSLELKKSTALPGSLQQKLVASGAATSAQAAGGMRQIPTPMAVSGLRGDRLATFSERMEKRGLDAHAYPAGAVAPGAPASVDEIEPGGNVAAALSYGDVTTAGVGTTTAVCDGDQVLAFGHPFLWSGRSSMSVHSADAVLVQRDDTFGSFKVANPRGVVGTLEQDRLTGIRGVLGTAPEAVPVTATVTSEGSTRTGSTQITMPDWVSDLAPMHLLGNIDRVFDQVGPGSADLRWVIQGRRASGAPFTLDVRNKYASSDDISLESVLDSADQLWSIQANEFENAKVTGVTFTATVSNEFRKYSVSAVQVRRPDGTFRAVSSTTPLRLIAGTRLNLRVILSPYRDVGPKQNVDISVVVPAGTVGGTGWVDILGGASGGGFEDPDDPGDGNGPSNFDDLLGSLRGLVPNNAVTAILNVEKETPDDPNLAQSTRRMSVDQVVTGFRTFPIEVVAPAANKPVVVDGRTWKSRSSLTGGAATSTFTFGSSTAKPLMGDWDGNDRTSPARFEDGRWSIRMTSTSTTTKTLTYGKPGDVPVVGDWDGNGTDDIGVYRKGRWLLRTSLTAGPANQDFLFGESGWRPVTGDWNGDGIDTIGLFRNGHWQLRNTNSAGAPSATLTYGRQGDVPVVGDWNRDGRGSVGVYRSGTWFYRNSLTSGSSKTFTFGGRSSKPAVLR